ncbi:hypothetical protein FB567DRAFT_185409 [Paraphoma chrysanthemicola]|uniref:F-box domain-containing protein n=1 Tax=Paraphoma chrysanthemicola TaxID=798071 RepID=A0A8K0VUJ5_9PLEO|nr:hypothetical protein FB567DRAFT_185409 [Paraphoma chrysanthemicola]
MDQPTLPSLTSQWIAELDDIYPDALLRPFASTFLGRLPPELVEIIIGYISPPGLPAVARTHSMLRSLAERRLYREIKIPHRESGQAKMQTKGKDLWPLCRTLYERPDLARRIKSLQLIAWSNIHPIPASDLLSTAFSSSSASPTMLDEAAITGHILGRASQLDFLILGFYQRNPGNNSYSHPRLMASCLSKAFPGFQSLSTTATIPSGFENIRFLHYAGSEWHWIMGQSCHLDTITLERVANFLPDGVPDEVNPKVKRIELNCCSAILNPEAEGFVHFPAFLAHFPELESLELRIYDEPRSWNESSNDIGPHRLGSYSHLVSCLDAVAHGLNELRIPLTLYNEDERPDYTLYALPASSFLNFSNLGHPGVPYVCLFGSVDAQWSHIMRSMEEIIPPSLKSLTIFHPRIGIFDWLMQLRFYRKQLPSLNYVDLYIHSVYGDSYEEFVFISHPHPVLSVAASLDVELSYLNLSDWHEPWDDYDLELWDHLTWFDSFGFDCDGIKLTSPRSLAAAWQVDNDMKATLWKYNLEGGPWL